MKMTVTGFTREARGITPEELDALKIHCGKNAGISQLRDQYFDSAVSDPEKAAKRFVATVKMGHTSIANHGKVEVLFEDATRFLAMIMNSLQYYDTTEKSGRYTKMHGNSPEQCNLYDKWNARFKKRILEVYPDYNDIFIRKQLLKDYKEEFDDGSMTVKNGKVYKNGNDDIADTSLKHTMEEIMDNPRLPVNTRSQENARYILSIFTKSTTFGYTTSIDQWNFIYDCCINYMNQFHKGRDGVTYRINCSPAVPATWFEMQVLADLKDLSDYIRKNLYVPEIRDRKKRTFDMLTTMVQPEHAMAAYSHDEDENIAFSYLTDYLCSFIVLSHLHRHRTLKYWIDMSHMSEPGYFGWYIPEFIKGTDDEKEWVEDLESVRDLYPQGMRLHVIEAGTLDNFILKTSERFCGCAMLETMMNVRDVAIKFVTKYKAGKTTDLEDACIERFYDPDKDELRTKRTITEGCREGCYFGCAHAIDRIV